MCDTCHFKQVWTRISCEKSWTAKCGYRMIARATIPWTNRFIWRIALFMLLTMAETHFWAGSFPLLYVGYVKKRGSPLRRGLRRCTGHLIYHQRRTFEGFFARRLFRARETRRASFSVSSMPRWIAAGESNRVGARRRRYSVQAGRCRKG